MRWARREFLRQMSAVGLSPTLLRATRSTPELAVQDREAASDRALDLAEWSYFWVGVEQAHLPRGTVVNGKQMYVEYWIPAQVRHPHAMILVHGGGGQGTDWMGTPDGRPGWVTYLLQAGFRVYVVDRPGHGRSPFHPDLHGPFPAQTNTLESMSGQFTPPNAARPAVGPYRKLHTQWPGTGEIGSPDLDQLVASQGGSYTAAGAPAVSPAARGGPAGPGGPGGRGAAPAGGRGGAGVVLPAPPIDGGASIGAETAHMVWRQRGAMLLDKIGPAIVMTHSAGGPFGWLVAEARPNLVKGIICIEGAGAPFVGQNIWGLSTIPVAYDPPAATPADIRTREVTPREPGGQPYRLQEEPARRLKNLPGIPIAIVTAEASFFSPGNPAAIEFLKQAGCRAEELRLPDHGVHGNGHMMMIEKNNRQVLQPIVEWIQKNVPASAARTVRPPIAAKKTDSTAMKLADQGFFWVGTEHKAMPYGTIISGQMYVQYLVPAEQRHPYPVVLVHGGGAQMLHYMGAGDGLAGWAHYYVQEGYRIYLVDRPGHGRSPYHPDALGAIGPLPTYAGAVANFRRAATGPHRQWSGTGGVGDPLVDRFMASQNAPPLDGALAQRLWASRGAALLDRIGPAILQTHSAGGPFGWLAASERPTLVKAIVCVEGGETPPVMTSLRGIPIAYVTADQSGRTEGPEVVARLKQAGCDADDLQLKDRGILGNGHLMMLENNRRQVFNVIRAWIEEKIGRG